MIGLVEGRREREREKIKGGMKRFHLTKS